MDASLRRFAQARRWLLSVVETEDSLPVLKVGVAETAWPAPAVLQALRQHCLNYQLEIVAHPPEAFDVLWQRSLENSIDNADLNGMQQFEDSATWEGLISSLSQDTTDLLSPEAEGPMIRLLNSILSEALRLEASDIHCIPQETITHISFRCDGQLHTRHQLPRHLHAALCARVKVMANLDVAETRHPQDGRLSIRIGSLTTDVRVSCVPTSHGERIVLRMLYRERLLTLNELGMATPMQSKFDELIHAPHGLILVTGPTGSGKTTTLYAALDRLRSGSENIITVEDPVEYRLEGISQIPVQPNIHFHFPDALRAILRQDPDIIMIGEIRDRETAQIAIQASLTGHLVLATLHTNDAPSAISRLLDMGVEPFLLASTLRGVLAQRLIRKLCELCKAPMHPTLHARFSENYAITASAIYHGSGCDHCNHSGFKGRTGIYELLPITPHLQELIQNNSAEQSIRTEITEAKHATLLDDGLRWVNSGQTTIAEVCRTALTHSTE
ncbi:MAG: GspE/PulE family protein [Pseudomonadota bacterium]